MDEKNRGHQEPIWMALSDIAPKLRGVPRNTPFFKASSGLWLPSNSASTKARPGQSPEEAAQPILRFAAVTAGWRHYSGYVAPITEIVLRLRRYSLREIAGFVARVSAALQLKKADVPPAPPNLG